MRWRNLSGSENVEDRRGRASGMRGAGLPVGGKMGAVLLVVVLVAGYYGYDLTPLLGLSGAGESVPMHQSVPEGQDDLARFASVALKTTEETWDDIFRRKGASYRAPDLVLFSGSTDTACGYGQSAMGPFYCPADGKVYIDLSFYRDMERKLGGGGDFALGYVLAHEVGHHVQNLLGISDRVRGMMARTDKAGANRLSVLQELQADCLAGVWGGRMRDRGILESGDLEEALNTASAIGDDRLQRESMGRVAPDSFTHGTSAQRIAWFRRGYDSGDPERCNTFAAHTD